MNTATIDFPPLATKPAADIAPLSIQDTVLQQFRSTEPGIVALADKYRSVAFDCATTKGMNDAKAARLDLRDNGRYMVQRAEKRIKAEVNALKETMADEAARLIAIIEPVEAHVDGQIKAREEQIAAEKAERERIAAEAAAAAAAAEAARKAKHEAGLARITGYVAQANGKTAAQIAAGIAYVQANITIDPAAWEEYATRAEDALYGTLQALQEMHDTALAREHAAAVAKLQAEENARVAAENARIAAELAEQRRAIQAQVDALRAQQEQAAAEAARIAARAAAAAQDSNRNGVVVPRAATPHADAGVAAMLAAMPQPDTERQEAQQVLKAEGASPDATDRAIPATTSPSDGSMGAGQAAVAAPAADDKPAEVPTLTMGAINARLSTGVDNGVSLTGAYVAALGIVGVKAPKGPGMLFTESQYRTIVYGHIDRLAKLADGFEAFED